MYSETYAYNGTTGNLSNKSSVGAYTYPSGKHRVTSAGSIFTLVYDANGNMTTRTTSGSTYTLGYDYENRLTSVSGAATASFVYDGDGNRVKSIVGATTTYFVGSHYETSGGVITKYYLAGGTRVAMRTGSTFYWLLSDHLGSTSKVATSTGALHSQQLYKAWGESRYTSGTLPTRYTYTGQYTYANDFGLVFYGSRFYDPLLSRWTSPDSIIPEATQGTQAWDRMAYVNNNPVRWDDPSGHCVGPLSFVLCTGAALGAAVSVTAYAVVSAATGQEMTLGGIAGAAIGGAIAGAVSVVAAPLAGSVMAAAHIGVTAGSSAIGAAIVNSAGGALAYLASGFTSNVVDELSGKEPTFTPTLLGAATSAGLAGGLSYGVGQLFPVAIQAGQSSIPQAMHFLPGRTPHTILTTLNAQHQYGQVALPAFMGTAGSAAIMQEKPTEEDKDAWHGR